MSGDFAIYPSLRDKVVVVTGGGSGIGASIVAHFCAQKAKVAFLDIDRASSESLVERIKAEGHPPPVFLPCDLTDIEALRDCIDGIGETLGRVEVLVNNAANDDRHDIEDIEPEYFDNRMAINLRHQVFADQAVIPDMKQAGGGSIINMASAAGYVKGLPGQFTFSTTKAAVIGLTKSVAAECVSHGIRCNAICPGVIDTPSMNDRLKATGDYEGTRTTLLSRLPMGRFGTPEEVASLVVFVAGAPYLTGQTFMIDGGWTA